MTETLPQEMTYEQLLEARDQANHRIEELKSAVQIVNEEIMQRLAAENITGKVVGNWGISKATRFSFDTSIEEAEALGAVKQVVDQTELKSLLKKGVAVPGVRKSEYIIVREVEKADKKIEAT